MKKKFLVIWIILSLCVLVGGIVFLIVAPSWTAAFIWYGICIVIQLPTIFLAIKEDITESGRIMTFIFMVLLAPFWLLVNIYFTFKYRF